MENRNMQEKIEELLNDENLRSSVKKEVIIGLAGDALVKNAAENGININGFTHSLDNFFIGHVFNKHGDEKAEAKRGNINVTAEDIKKIPSIIESPDFIIYGTKTKNGNKAIVFAKNINNSTIFVEEIRTGRKRLAAQTLYKRSRAIDVSSIKNAPELYAHSDPGTIKIIDVKEEIVKRMFLSDTKKKTIQTKILLGIKKAFNKIKGAKSIDSQIVADSITKHGSLPNQNIHHDDVSANTPKKEAGAVRNVSALNDSPNISQAQEKSILLKKLTTPIKINVDGTTIPCKQGILAKFKENARLASKLLRENKLLKSRLAQLTKEKTSSKDKQREIDDKSNSIGD